MKVVCVLLFSFIISSCFYRRGGINLAVNKKMFRLILEYFYKDINNEIKYIKVGNVDGLEDINFGISNFHPDLINFYFRNDNKINIDIRNLKAHLHLLYHTKILWFIPVSTNVDIKITKLDISFDIEIGGDYDSYGNLIPKINMLENSFDIHIDFDFNLDGILNWIKGLLKGKVSNQLNNELKSKINSFMNQAVEKIPKKIVIDEKKGYYIDYSLISPLEIYNDMILVNSYGLLYNANIEETKNKNRYNLTKDLLEYDKEGKNFQVIIGDYAIKNALFTLYKSNELIFKVTSEMLNRTVNQTLNINLISKVYKGLENIYDKEKKVNITLKANSLPKIELVKDYIYLYIPTNIKIEIDEDICILEYDTNIEFKGNAEIIENQNMTGKIISIISRNTNITLNNVTSLTNEYLENKFNLFGDIIKSIFNFYIYDNNIFLKLPKYKDINFYDMSIEHENNYLILNYNLRTDIRSSNISHYLVLMIFIIFTLIFGIHTKRKKHKKLKREDSLLENEGEELKDLNKN